MSTQENPDQKSRRHNRRAGLAMLGLFALAVVCIAVSANWYLRNARQRQWHETAQSLSVQTANQVALLTVWSGSLTDQVRTFVGQDWLRLFAAEAANTGQPAAAVLELAATLEAEPMSLTAPLQDTAAPLAALAPRLPATLRQLRDFKEKNSFLRVSLLNAAGEIFLSAGKPPQLDEAQRTSALKAFSDKQPVFLPARREDGLLVMDMASPVFTPLYMDASGVGVPAVLLLSANVSPVVKAVSRTGESAILQALGNSLQRLDPQTGPHNLPGWQLENGRLPPAMREDNALPEHWRQSYCLAEPVPGLPWLVAQGVPAPELEAQYAHIRKNALLASLVFTALAGIMLAALWWWLVGRNERAVADQLRRLYRVVNQQKQIMDGVNSALSAGIVLNDFNGRLFYANQGFARMTGLPAEQLPGMAHTDLGPDLARSLVTHTLAVYQTQSLSSFTETLPIRGQTRYFLTSCTPFRDEQSRITGVVSVYSDMTELALAQQRAQLMVTQAVNAFVRAIEAVDAYLRGHSDFTAQLAVLLARQLGRDDPETLATLRTAAKLSQLGMIQLPKELLTKSGSLTPDERAQLERHVDYAREALAGIDFGLPVLEAMTQMHERLDGSGYPDHLQGENICPNARILAVANTFCALVRPRSYRTALPVDAALKLLKTTPPSYDPQVIAALQTILGTDEGKTFFTRLQNGQEA